jgi:CubicO group peptidase (beta-lactamase class C family)
MYGVFGLTLLILITGCERAVEFHDVEAEMQQLFTDHNLPSLAALVVNDGTVVWSRHYGYSNQEKQILVDGETVYHIGSISKLFIVTAIMQLEEQGKIDLDEDINTYLPVAIRHPDFPDIPITAKMLLTHRAGISWPQSYDGEQGMWNNFDPDQGPPPSEWVPQYLIPSGPRYDASLWKPIRPGAYEFYSNIGTCVLAYLVEQISGENFRDYCKKHIFLPLNMPNTSYSYADLQGTNIALLYNRQKVGSAYFDNRVYPAGGAKSTVRDLSRFAMCYMNGGILDGTRILREASVNQILTVQNPATGRCLLWNAHLGAWRGHTGGLILGTATTLLIHPPSKTALVIFTNAHSGSVHPGGDIFWLVKQKANEYIE